jgi:hypothetical protein
MKSRNAIAALLAGLFALALAAAPALAQTRDRLAINSRVGVVDSATLAACTTGTSASQRSARFSATMQALPRTASMAVSFDLYERAAGGRFAQVPDPGFGSWQSSNPGVTTFTATENVLDLPAPGSFRALVHYRWLNARHRLIRIDTRITPSCREPAVPAAQPDLFVFSIAHAPGAPPTTTEDYTVRVRNAGSGAASSFAVAFSVGGTSLPDQTVNGLAADTNTSVLFTGPRCSAGSTLTATVDPSGAISEPSNGRRTVSIPCPSTAAAQGDTGNTGTSGSSGSDGTSGKKATRTTS